MLFEGKVKAVIELASFHRFSEVHLTFLDQLTESIGIVLNTIEANMRTEELLKSSQSLTQELTNQQEELQKTNARLEQQAHSLQASEQLLKEQQEELQQTNEELEEKARLLSRQNTEVESKNRQIELAKQELEEKAEQLSLTSKYKSEFLANMSHELRTPLNSLLILSNLLSQNAEDNLTPKQVEFAHTIHSSGADLLALINEILDLAKIESGTMEVDVHRVPFADLRVYVERNFRQVAQDKGLDFGIELDPGLPHAIATDPQRLQQVLRNLLSNAFKFTERGRVDLRVGVATSGWSSGCHALEPGRGRDRLRGQRHGHRHPRGQAQDHLRGVPAGRRDHQPQVRGDGPRPVDQPGDRRAARRRDPGRQHRRPGEHVHALPAPGLHAPGPRRRGPGRRGRPAPAAPGASGRAGGNGEPRRGRRRAGQGAGPTRHRRGRAVALLPRGRRRPRRHPGGRPRPPDRRGRRQLRQVPARPGPREGLPGPRRPAGRRGPGHGPRARRPTPSSSTSSSR